MVTTPTMGPTWDELNSELCDETVPLSPIGVANSMKGDKKRDKAEDRNIRRSRKPKALALTMASYMYEYDVWPMPYHVGHMHAVMQVLICL